jgi:hypothetical protein
MGMEDVFKTATVVPITTDKYNPFVSRDKVCLTGNHHPSIKVTSYTTMSNEWGAPIEASMEHNLLSYGPIPVGIDSQSLNFELYAGGIMDGSHCTKDIDHAVVVVGFTEHYWVLKNSWGEHWGEHGYFRLQKNTNACGINSYCSFVTGVEVTL